MGRTKVSVRKPMDVERIPRRKKDRPKEEDDTRVRNAPSVIHPDGKSPEQSDYDPNNYEEVYTFGMDERDKRRQTDGPGPGTHEIKSMNWRGPPFKKNDPAKESVVDRDHTGPSSYNIVLKSRAPKHSFGSKGGVGAGGIGYRNRGKVKDSGPGPGSYESRDVQFKKPCTKFSKAAKQTLTKMTGPPPSQEFEPEPVKLESDKYSFPLSKRFEEKKMFEEEKLPGPGTYESQNQLSKGLHKSMLGGAIDPPAIKDNGVPGAGHYFTDNSGSQYLNHIPTVIFNKKPDRFKQASKDPYDGAKNKDKKGKDDKDMRDVNPKNKMAPGWSIGHGLRDPIKSKFLTPGPDKYNVTDFPPIEEKKGEEKEKENKYKFHMGMRTNYKANRGQETPGPADYELDIYRPNSISHIISTGARSDLGVGKAHLAPGPGEYDIRGKFEGPQVKFGNEAKNTEIKKTHDPSPNTYDLPGTVGNIPKYLRLKQERIDAERFEDKSENMELI